MSLDDPGSLLEERAQVAKGIEHCHRHDMVTETAWVVLIWDDRIAGLHIAAPASAGLLAARAA
jgi:hypothetical protein